MQHISQIISRPKPTAPKPPSCAQQSQAVTLRQDQAGRKEVATIIYQCFQSLKLYGKEPEALEATVAMFQMVLADYPIERVRQGFAFYLRHNSEMPTPADIANIIDRGNKPPFDRSVYVALSRKDAEFRSAEEWQYIRDYEAFQVRGA